MIVTAYALDPRKHREFHEVANWYIDKEDGRLRLLYSDGGTSSFRLTREFVGVADDRKRRRR